MNKLHDLLMRVEPGNVPEATGLDRLLADHWDQFDGSDAGGMEAYKLLHRMETVQWQPPILTFIIERHGGTVCGSTRAELQHWSVDLDAKTATITKTGHRQLVPMAPRLSIKAIAQEVAQTILDGKQDDRLHWLDENTVMLRASSMFPTGSGFKMTVEGRRKTLCRYVEEILKDHGWAKQGWNVFVRNRDPSQSMT